MIGCLIDPSCFNHIQCYQTCAGMFLILPLRASLVQAGQQSGAHEISAWLKPPLSSFKVLLMSTRYGTFARRGSQKHKGLLTDPLLSLCCSINMIYLLLIIEHKEMPIYQT